MLLLNRQSDWMVLQLIVPVNAYLRDMEAPILTEVQVTIQLDPLSSNLIPGMFLSSTFFPPEFQFINLLGMKQGENCILTNLILKLVHEIDHVGLK